MRKYALLSVLFLGGLLSGCFNEDDIHVEDQYYKRVYDTTSNDPVWKYVSLYYFNCGKLLITDPDSSDYLYNFDAKYALWIQKPIQTQEGLLKRIQFFEDMFLGSYTNEFREKYFPFEIILADSIVYTGSLDASKPEGVPRDIYIADYYVAFSVSENTMNLSKEEKVRLSTAWNGNFLSRYLVKKSGWKVPEDFYLYPTDGEFYANCKYKTDEEWGEDNFWELGYPTGRILEEYSPNSEGKWGWNKVGYQFASAKDTYLSQFIDFLFSTDTETVERAISQHAKLKKAHDVLDQSLKSYLGIDYRNIGYK